MKTSESSVQSQHRLVADRPVRLLHLEDSAFDAELVAEALASFAPGLAIQRVRGEEDFVAALRRDGFDAILSDYRIPGFGGSEALGLALQLDPDAPFIFVSGAIGDDNAAELLRRGAADFVDKGRLGRLPVALERALRERAGREAREAAVRSRDQRLLFAARAGGMGIWELDLSTMRLAASEVCRAHLGRGPLKSLSYEDMLSAARPEDAEMARAAIEWSIANGTDCKFEVRISGPDGEERWIEARAAVERGSDGGADLLAGVTRDVTEAKLAEVRTRARLALGDVMRQVESPERIALLSAEALGQALGAVRAGYAQVDAGAETAEVALDWTAEGARSAAGVHRFRDFGSFIDELKLGKALAIGDVASDQRTSEHIERFESLGIRALLNVPVMEEGRLVAVLFIHCGRARKWSAKEIELAEEFAHRIRTGSQRRRAERGLRDLAATLEAKVEERSKELLAVEAELRQSQKMEAVGQLTGGLAHDFNNILASISGALELLSVRIAKGQVAGLERYVSIAKGATSRAASLTQRLLAFSRRQTLESKPVDLGRLVSGMQEMIQRSVGPSIDLRIAIGDELGGFRGDASQVENCLLNLCLNARDAMPSGGMIRVEAKNAELDAARASSVDLPPGPYVELCVRDDGVGMDPGTVAKAFDPFFTTKPLGQGTGLGLSMVHGFAMQSGGRALIESGLGHGTTVSILLPRDDDKPIELASTPSLAAGLNRGGKSILLVDDEEPLRALMAEALEEDGHCVSQAADGRSALVKLRAGEKFDLLVTDVGLPGGLNGRQLAEAARELSPGLPALFVTGYAEVAIFGERGLGDEMRALVKPFDLDDLRRAVDQTLAGGGA